jgi:6-phosphogluconolactonase (cycloisomerase 2 family)
MLSRRTFLSLLGTAAVAPRVLRAQPKAGGVALYASVGRTLVHYDLDVEAATLTRRGEVTLPASVQYAWPHASRRFLYVASSNTTAGSHHLNAFRRDATGGLTAHGTDIALPSRPINVCSDIPSEYLLVAFNSPSALRVYGVNPDGTLGAEVVQGESIDAGIYAHQVRVSPNNRVAILVTRGNDAVAGHPEDPGALKVFHYERGRLTQEVSIAPHGGFGFGPRHLDFHPTQPWVYVSRERENAISLFRMEGDRMQAEPAFTTGTLAAPSATRQVAGAIHLHPSGRFVYGVNRRDLAAIQPGAPLAAAGENSLAVFAIDPATGEPTPIQHMDTRGIHDRTFQIDPTGRVLVTAHMRTLSVTDGAAVRVVPAGLTIFRIGDDGRLEYVRKYDLEAGNEPLYWMGMVATAV